MMEMAKVMTPGLAWPELDPDATKLGNGHLASSYYRRMQSPGAQAPE